MNRKVEQGRGGGGGKMVRCAKNPKKCNCKRALPPKLLEVLSASKRHSGICSSCL